jgi:hypothetical protein
VVVVVLVLVLQVLFLLLLLLVFDSLRSYKKHLWIEKAIGLDFTEFMLSHMAGLFKKNKELGNTFLYKPVFLDYGYS